uniref:Si:ch211-214j24.10 n=1 Tax=Scleropages formosus TaxID=113540 RepID=A0A8C9R1F1_SCLFO
MHIKTGNWEASSTVCETDPLCDTAGLVSTPNPESQIRNRRLSPGSGNCGGGGGGGGRVGRDTCHSPASENHTHRHPYTHTFTSDRDRDRRGPAQGRNFRKETSRVGRAADKAQREKERWVEDSLSLLKPPPAFPVQDSPAKLQPAVSYASKVKRGGVGVVMEDPPGIGVLLQNQWGLSFISDTPQNLENSESQSPKQNGPSLGMRLVPSFGSSPVDPAESLPPISGKDSDRSAPTLPIPSVTRCRLEGESQNNLLLVCPHLVEAVQYHVQEWDTVSRRLQDGKICSILQFFITEKNLFFFQYFL